MGSSQLVGDLRGQNFLSGMLTELNGLGDKTEDVKTRMLDMAKSFSEGGVAEETGKFGNKIKEVFADINENTPIEEIKNKVNELGRYLNSEQIGDAKAIFQLSNAFNISKEKAQKLNEVLKEEGIVLQAAGTALDGAKVKYGDFAREVEKAARANQTLMGTMLGLVANLGGIFSALKSIVGLKDTWNNEDLSLFEKIATTFTTLGFALPMLYNNGVKLIGNFLNPFGMKAAAIIAIVAALALAFKGLYDWFNREKIALEKTTKAMEKNKKVVEETKKAYDELTGSVDKLAQQREALDKMDKSTQK